MKFFVAQVRNTDSYSADDHRGGDQSTSIHLEKTWSLLSYRLRQNSSPQVAEHDNQILRTLRICE